MLWREPARLLLALWALAALIACAPAPKAVEQPKPDPTTEDWYRETVEQLAALNREAESLLQRGEFDPAAEIITKGQPLEDRLLAVRQPTVAAMEAASDLDDLYGRMLLRNRHYGWARSLFQKNVIRWKTWKPQTPETARRWKVAVSAVAECDRHLPE
ncbi:MAG TPA: hypothetical protein VGZ73_25640 [Bryobacteraceae bacterium]|jgi:hypothetical protein|nr:hypothetical protein [Bryobacteraceae bacterium]